MRRETCRGRRCGAMCVTLRQTALSSSPHLAVVHQVDCLVAHPPAVHALPLEPDGRETPEEEGEENDEAEKGETDAFPRAALQIRQRAHAAEVDGSETDRSEQHETQRVATEPVRSVTALSTEQPLYDGSWRTLHFELELAHFTAVQIRGGKPLF